LQRIFKLTVTLKNRQVASSEMLLENTAYQPVS